MDMVASSCSVDPSTFLKVVDRFNAAVTSLGCGAMHMAAVTEVALNQLLNLVCMYV